jgi:SAM-dependent methyltransferase
MRDELLETPGSHSEEWVGWCCSSCGAPLVPHGSGLLCRAEERWFATRDGVHRLLPEERSQVLRAYGEISRRVARGPARGSREAEEHGRLVEEAMGRAREALGRGPWYVLAAGVDSAMGTVLAGHRIVAISPRAGQDGALVGHALVGHALVVRARAEAELDALPLEPGRVDLVVAQASLHEGPSLPRTLVELRRVVRRGGVLVALDSPVYRRRRDAEAQVAQAMKDERALVGMAVPREVRPGYLVHAELAGQFRSAGWSLQVLGWPSAVRATAEDLLQRLRGSRPSPRYPVLLARRDG